MSTPEEFHVYTPDDDFVYPTEMFVWDGTQERPVNEVYAWDGSQANLVWPVPKYEPAPRFNADSTDLHSIIYDGTQRGLGFLLGRGLNNPSWISFPTGSSASRTVSFTGAPTGYTDAIVDEAEALFLANNLTAREAFRKKSLTNDGQTGANYTPYRPDEDVNLLDVQAPMSLDTGLAGVGFTHVYSAQNYITRPVNSSGDETLFPVDIYEPNPNPYYNRIFNVGHPRTGTSNSDRWKAWVDGTDSQPSLFDPGINEEFEDAYKSAVAAVKFTSPLTGEEYNALSPYLLYMDSQEQSSENLQSGFLSNTSNSGKRASYVPDHTPFVWDPRNPSFAASSTRSPKDWLVYDWYASGIQPSTDLLPDVTYTLDGTPVLSGKMDKASNYEVIFAKPFEDSRVFYQQDFEITGEDSSEFILDNNGTTSSTPIVSLPSGVQEIKLRRKNRITKDDSRLQVWIEYQDNTGQLTWDGSHGFEKDFYSQPRLSLLWENLTTGQVALSDTWCENASSTSDCAAPNRSYSSVQDRELFRLTYAFRIRTHELFDDQKENNEWRELMAVGDTIRIKLIAR